MTSIDLQSGEKIIVNPISFFSQDHRQWIDGTNALFATMNAGFGGFSQAYVWDLCRLHNPAADPKFTDIDNIPDNPVYPLYIATEITRTAEGAEALMNKIINVSMSAGFKKIRLCQLVFLNSPQEEIFFAIATSIWERLRTGLPASFPETIVFDVDERHAKVFESTIRAALNNLKS